MLNSGHLKHLFSLGLIFIVVAGFVSCSSAANTPPQGNTSTAPIKIGFSVSLSGDFSSDGKSLLQGYQLWADTINKQGGLLGRQVTLDYTNDNSDPNQVTTDYQKLINVDHVDLVVGPFSTLLTVPAARVAARYNYAFVEGAGAGNGVFDLNLHNLFSASMPVKHLMSSFAEFILSLPQQERPKTVAFVTADDPFAGPEVATAKTLLTQGGLTKVDDEVYPAETTDFTPFAQKVVASHADIFVLGSVGLPESVAFIKYFKQQHYNPKAFIAASGPDQGDSFTSAIGGAQDAEGIFVPNDGWYPGAATYQNDQFTKDYLAKYGGSAADISSDTVQAYSTMQILAQAVNKIHSFDNAKLIQELHSDTFNSLQGPLQFAPDGENSVAVAFLFQWQKGQLIPVYPTNSAQANPEYPRPNWP